MKAGFETEFYLLKNVVRYANLGFFVQSNRFHNLFNTCPAQFLLRDGKQEYVPFDFGPYSSTSSFDAASPIFHEIVPALESLNIVVEQVTNNLYIIYFRMISHISQTTSCFLYSFMLKPGKVSLKYLWDTPLHQTLPTILFTHVKL